MDTIYIFTDAATSPQMNVSIGAFICVDKDLLQQYAECNAQDLNNKLIDQIVYQQYSSKKSTWSEIKTAIDALHFVHANLPFIRKIEIYTDCQSLCDLLNKRKEKLQNNNFITRTGKTLNNANLYKELFECVEKFEIQVLKIKGHSSTASRLTIQEKIFAALDKLSRKKLRAIAIG